MAWSKNTRYPAYYDGTIDADTLDPELATSDSDGLMSKEDKAKLDSIKFDGGTLTPVVKAEDVIKDDNHQFVTKEQIKKWDQAATTGGIEYDEENEMLVFN